MNAEGDVARSAPGRAGLINVFFPVSHGIGKGRPRLRVGAWGFGEGGGLRAAGRRPLPKDAGGWMGNKQNAQAGDRSGMAGVVVVAVVVVEMVVNKASYCPSERILTMDIGRPYVSPRTSFGSLRVSLIGMWDGSSPGGCVLTTCQLSPTGGPTSGTDGFYRGGRYPTTTMTTGTGTSYDGPSPFFSPPFERLWHQSNETKVITTAAEG